MEYKLVYDVSVFLVLFILPKGLICDKEKTVRLIVPHKIKYIHHTHILLVRPKKASAKLHQIPDEESSYNHHNYRHENPRSKRKPIVHYIVPNVASAKTGGAYHEKEERHLGLSDSHQRTPKPSVGKNKRSKTPTKDPYMSNESSVGHSTFIINQAATEDFPLAAAYVNPQEYETKYLGYNTFSDNEPQALSTDWSSSSYRLPDNHYDPSYGLNDNVWDVEPFTVPDETNSASYLDEGNIMGLTTVSMPEQYPLKKHTNMPYSLRENKESRKNFWDAGLYKMTEAPSSYDWPKNRFNNGDYRTVLY